jgi:hypothetical protein
VRESARNHVSACEKSRSRCGFRIAQGAESARERRSSAKASALQAGLTIALVVVMPTQTPSVAALESSKDGPLVAEVRLVTLRSQAAVVRTLADQVEQLSRAADVDALGTQMVEEMARLGCRLLDAAAALADALPVEDSGVFKRAAVLETVHWETPTYDLVRMDAEIGSYQEDDDPGREAPSFLPPATRDVEAS